LMLGRPQQADLIRDVRVRLTKAVFQHPPNPYECCLIEAQEQDTLRQLFEVLQPVADEDRYRYLPTPWKHFWHCWQRSGQLMWAAIARSQGQFSLYCQPVEVATALSQVWSQQPVVLIGEALDLEASASVYRQQLGLGDLTCLKFSPDRQSELIQLYLPDGLPMPNTPRFQEALIQQVRTLLTLVPTSKDQPFSSWGMYRLKLSWAQILAANLVRGCRWKRPIWMTKASSSPAGNFGALIKVFPAPQLLMIATLPIPSLENPLVAGQVAYYKQQRLDWFRLYLLPAALRELQRAIAPVRESQGVVALLDNRVNHRSYGRQVLSALSPFARINYLDAVGLDQTPQRNQTNGNKAVLGVVGTVPLRPW
jgi:ATP-dependent DNA helicase DinG